MPQDRHATLPSTTLPYRSPGIRHQLLRKSEVRSPCNWSALGATPVLLAAVEFHSPGCGYGWVKGEWECRGRSAVYMTTCAFVFASLWSCCSLTTTCKATSWISQSQPRALQRRASHAPPPRRRYAALLYARSHTSAPSRSALHPVSCWHRLARLAQNHSHARSSSAAHRTLPPQIL